MVDSRSQQIRREEEISLQAGILVGKLYDALIKEYIEPDEGSFRSLNILCVRLVFCFYAEDAGLFETRTSFEDYIKSFSLPSLRDAFIKLFKGLDTELENRDKYDTSLRAFPYVNGGLFAAEDIEIPSFTQEIVDVLMKVCAPFDWREISPTIFGIDEKVQLNEGLFAGFDTEIDGSEIRYDYVMGNPPFVGHAYQSERQQIDLSKEAASVCNS